MDVFQWITIIVGTVGLAVSLPICLGKNPPHTEIHVDEETT